MILKKPKLKLPTSWFELYDKWAHRFTKPEEKLAIACAFYLHEKHPKLDWWHTQNEGKRGWYQQVLARLLGVKPGVPDIFIARTRDRYDCGHKENVKGCEFCFNFDYDSNKPGIYNGFFCELKVKPNKPTPSQQEMFVKLTKEGYYCTVCYSLDEFINEVSNYLGNS